MAFDLSISQYFFIKFIQIVHYLTTYTYLSRFKGENSQIDLICCRLNINMCQYRVDFPLAQVREVGTYRRVLAGVNEDSVFFLLPI